MKICPRCQKTYSDDNLNFCLEDGSVLTQASQAPQTVFVNQPQATAPQQQMPSQPQSIGGGQPPWNVGAPQQQYSMQPPKKSSKTWIWVLLILGVLALVCGGGLVGFFAFVSSQNDRVANVGNTGTTNTNKTTFSTNKTAPPSNSTNSNTSSTIPTSSRTDLSTVDLSKWVGKPSDFGNKEFTNGEFLMSSKKKGFYYVLVAPDDAPDDYKTEKADTRVTLRNVDNAAGSLGYGLIFHSNPTPLVQDYAFLIDTKRGKYRVASHTPSNEKSVVPWTTSSAIKPGSEENVLEARDQNGTVDLYINGTKVTSIKNTDGYSGGVAGLYSGDGVKIAFKNLELRK